MSPTFIIYAVVVLFITAGGFTLVRGLKHGAVAEYQAQVAEQEQVIKTHADELKAVVAKNTDDMLFAYNLGEENAKVVTRTVYLKGQQNVATYEVFRNPQCVLPPLVLSELNSTRTGVQSAPVAGGGDAAMSGTGSTTGRSAGNVVPANVERHGTIPSVQSAPSGSSGSGQVSGAGTRRVPTNPLSTK